MSIRTTNTVFSMLAILSAACGSVDPSGEHTTDSAQALSPATSACSALAASDFDQILTRIDAGLAAAATDVAACDGAPDRCADRGRTTYEQSLLQAARSGSADARKNFVEAFAIAPANSAWYVQSALLDVLYFLQSAAVTATLSANANASPTSARAVHERSSEAHELAADLRARAGRCYMGIP